MCVLLLHQKEVISYSQKVPKNYTKYQIKHSCNLSLIREFLLYYKLVQEQHTHMHCLQPNSVISLITILQHFPSLIYILSFQSTNFLASTDEQLCVSAGVHIHIPGHSSAAVPSQPPENHISAANKLYKIVNYKKVPNQGQVGFNRFNCVVFSCESDT